MKVYRIAYLGSDNEAVLGLETALKGDGLQFMSAGADYQGMQQAVDFNADVFYLVESA